MINIKTTDDVRLMLQGGKIASRALNTALSTISVGIETREIDEVVGDVIRAGGAKASFTMVEDYRFATCININEGLVHGLPGKYRIKKGDLVSIDLGVYYKGFHTDLSHTVEVVSNKYERFLSIGRKALNDGISKCVIGNRIGDVSAMIQAIVESAGYTVSRDLVGHGIGRELHEDPYIPCYGNAGTGPVIREGMVFAVEVIYQEGKSPIKVSRDGWTVLTKDASMGGLFEHTVAVMGGGPKILTGI